jgi:predicted ATPase
MMGYVLCFRGEPAQAQFHLTQALAIYSPQDHRDLVVRYGNADLGSLSGSFLAWQLWQLGYPDQALQHSQAAIRLAQDLSHPLSLTVAFTFAARLHQHRREALAVHEQAEAATTLATEHGFAMWLPWGTILHGWARAMQGQSEAGIAEMRQGLAADLVTGAKTWWPYHLGLLAEAYGEGGHSEEGLPLLTEAWAMMDTTESRWYKAELHRLKGELLQQSPDKYTEAETCFRQAITVAQSQQAKSWEIRAATSLARLWQSQGKRQDAYELLSPVYGWFTEGFDTADLKEAKLLLQELA